MSRSVDFFGETFRLTDDPADIEFAYLEFCEAAADTDASSTAGGAAVMSLLRAALADGEWDRFKSVARKNRARTERDLMPIVVALVEGQTDRPTQRPSDSSDGPPATAPSSTDGSYSLASRLQGRPDLMVIIEDAQAAQRTA